ncbi:MAG: aminopeptidase P family protein, partial [Symploca sp. SIO2B6]|nr:aminopeptidase P family protein [Symploca sp. SIO2B6]
MSMTSLKQRRQQLAHHYPHPVILWSGRTSSRNFPANTYPFRCNSHWLYFAGVPLQNAAIRMAAGSLHLFMDNPSASSTLWHGPEPSRDEIAETIGADAAFPLAALKDHAEGAATIQGQDAATQAMQSLILNRSVNAPARSQGIDQELAIAIATIRLTHDDAALAEMREAAAVTIEAHKAGMRATQTATHESTVRAAMEQVIMAHNMTCAYNSIVTVHGDVLHNNHYHHPIAEGDLL